MYTKHKPSIREGYAGAVRRRITTHHSTTSQMPLMSRHGNFFSDCILYLLRFVLVFRTDMTGVGIGNPESAKPYVNNSHVVLKWEPLV